MIVVLEVDSASGKTTVQGEFEGCMEVKFLTLKYPNSNSDVRFHVSVYGQDADVDWQEGDKLMLELRCPAYKHHNQWCVSHQADSVEFIECSINKNII